MKFGQTMSSDRILFPAVEVVEDGGNEGGRRHSLIVFLGVLESFSSLMISLLQRNELTLVVDRIHKWHQRNQSFLFVFIILISLTLKEKFF